MSGYIGSGRLYRLINFSLPIDQRPVMSINRSDIDTQFCERVLGVFYDYRYISASTGSIVPKPFRL